MKLKSMAALAALFHAMHSYPASADEAARNQPSDHSLEDEIVVTATPIGRSLDETIAGASVLRGERLARRAEGSIGETLRREPGISSTFFGPGASRPIIRGLGGDRIRILDSGIGSLDASATSGDHAVAIDPALAERIEVLRGSAMLLYGSSAAGGVVNLFDGRIPEASPPDGVRGRARYTHSSGDNGDHAAVAMTAKAVSLGQTDLVLHGEGLYREADDYAISSFARTSALRAREPLGADEPFGRVVNSQVETKSGAAGMSLISQRGLSGFSVKILDSAYGVPGGDEEVRIDLDQTRFDWRSEYDADLAPFETAKLRFGYGDYSHAEVEETGEIGTVFSNRGWEGRLELVQKPAGGWTGAVGAQAMRRDYSAIGEEAFVPPTLTRQFGLFVLEELTAGDWRFELGGRYEHTRHRANAGAAEREFDGLSLSGGVGVEISDWLFGGVQVFRTERAPSIEELFSNGPHLASQSFEVGDSMLGKETALGVEVALKYGSRRASFTLNGFHTRFDGFIFEAPTAEQEDGLPVFRYMAADARFYGFEAGTRIEFGEIGRFHLHGDAALDFVRARTDDPINRDLPRIPPLSALIGVDAHSARLDLRVEAEMTARQSKAAAFEDATGGYALFNAFATFRPFAGNSEIALELAALNLTDETAREHTSQLKERVPLPGRTIRFTLSAGF